MAVDTSGLSIDAGGTIHRKSNKLVQGDKITSVYDESGEYPFDRRSGGHQNRSFGVAI